LLIAAPDIQMCASHVLSGVDGTQPEITTIAEAVLRESGSPYTLPGLIDGLDEVISQLTRAMRQAIADVSPLSRQDLASS
jgi:hypothetical protein